MLRLISLVVITFLISGCMLTKTKSEKIYKESKAKVYDAIIVPGIPFNGKVWNRTMKGRIYWAKHLYDSGIARNIIFSGSSVYTPYCEGEIMAMYAREIGISTNHIFIEDKAEHSTENVYYSFKLAQQLGFKKVALATDPFQGSMLKKFVRKKVENIDILPIVFNVLRKMEPDMIDPAIDDSSAFRSTFVSILDRESKLKRFRGTLGLNINTSYYD